jgi:predicted heme/steroid binding protein
MAENKTFNEAQLAENNGKNGKPAYVAYRGTVYEVTESYQWLDGDHLGHEAGKDLTDAMDIAPHSSDVMERMKKVGTLVKV